MRAKTILRVIEDATKDFRCVKAYQALTWPARDRIDPLDLCDDPREERKLCQAYRILDHCRTVYGEYWWMAGELKDG